MPKVNVLITGAGGFIGKELVKELINQGYRVTAMIRPNSLAPFDPHKNLEVIWADIINYQDFSEKVKSANIIVHLAANKYHSTLSFKTNIEGARNIVRLVNEKKINGNRIINISTQSTKIKWKGVYGKSKSESDKIIESSETNWTTLKPSLVYGPGKDSLFNTISNYIKKMPFIPVIGNGKWKVHPISTQHLSKIIIAAIQNPWSVRKIYDVGSPQEITFDELVRLIGKELKVQKKILHIPIWLGLPAVFLYNKISKTPKITIDNVLGSNQSTHFYGRNTQSDLKVKIQPVKLGIKDFFKEDINTKKIAIVGFGKMGLLHTAILNTLEEVKIKAIVENDTKLKPTISSLGLGANIYGSLEEAIKNEQLDVVYICTPNSTHSHLMHVCLDKRINYFVEKPTTTNIADLKKILYKNKNLVAGVGYFYLFKREIQYTKKLLDSGLIGKPISYKINLVHGEVFGPKQGWMFNKQLSGGGVLMNPGPHAFSIVSHFFGKGRILSSKLKYLFNREIEDEAHIETQHDKTLNGNLFISWSVPNVPILRIDYEIVGSHGKITFKNGILTIEEAGGKKNLLPYPKIPFSHEVFNINLKAWGDAYYVEDYSFVKAITTKTKLLNDLNFAYDTESMISEAYAKAKSL